MFPLGSLARRSFGAFLAWLAIASLGGGAIARDLGAGECWLSGQAPVARTDADAGRPFVRAAAIKLAALHRNGDDDRRIGSGDPALVPLVFIPALAGIAVFLFTPAPSLRVAALAATPYSARAPPLGSI